MARSSGDRSRLVIGVGLAGALSCPATSSAAPPEGGGAFDAGDPMAQTDTLLEGPLARTRRLMRESEARRAAEDYPGALATMREALEAVPADPGHLATRDTVRLQLANLHEEAYAHDADVQHLHDARRLREQHLASLADGSELLEMYEGLLANVLVEIADAELAAFERSGDVAHLEAAKATLNVYVDELPGARGDTRDVFSVGVAAGLSYIMQTDVARGQVMARALRVQSVLDAAQASADLGRALELDAAGFTYWSFLGVKDGLDLPPSPPRDPAAVVDTPMLQRARLLPRWAGVTGVVVGVGLLASSAVLLHFNGRCPGGLDPVADAEVCPFIYTNLGTGIATAALGGAALLGFGVVLSVDELRAGRARGRTAMLTWATRF